MNGKMHFIASATKDFGKKNGFVRGPPNFALSLCHLSETAFKVLLHLSDTRKISQDFLGFFSVAIDFPYFPEIPMLSRDFSCLFCHWVQMAPL